MFRNYFFLDSIPYVQTASLCPEGVVAGGGQTRCWPCHVGGDAVGDQAATLHVPVIHRAVTDGPMWFRLKAALGFRRTELLTCRQGLGLRTCGGSEVGEVGARGASSRRFLFPHLRSLQIPVPVT